MIWTSKLCVISKIMWMRLTVAYIDRLHYDAFIVNTWFLRQLTHWGRVVHICVSKLTIIGSDNGLSPGLRQAIIWTNAGILLIGQPKKINEILLGNHSFSFMKIHLKMPSGKWLPFGVGVNVLKKRFLLTSRYWYIAYHCAPSLRNRHSH